MFSRIQCNYVTAQKVPNPITEHFRANLPLVISCHNQDATSKGHHEMRHSLFVTDRRFVFVPINSPRVNPERLFARSEKQKISRSLLDQPKHLRTYRFARQHWGRIFRSVTVRPETNPTSQLPVSLAAQAPASNVVVFHVSSPPVETLKPCVA